MAYRQQIQHQNRMNSHCKIDNNSLKIHTHTRVYTMGERERERERGRNQEKKGKELLQTLGTRKTGSFKRRRKPKKEEKNNSNVCKLLVMGSRKFERERERERKAKVL